MLAKKGEKGRGDRCGRNGKEICDYGEKQIYIKRVKGKEERG
jgi:hypothetical protein